MQRTGPHAQRRPQHDRRFTLKDRRDQRRAEGDARHCFGRAGYHPRVMRNQPWIVLVAAAAISLSTAGCSVFGGNEIKPARETGPPERTRWFLPIDGSPPEPTETIAGRARVLDADTLTVDGAVVHLSGLDAPELEQLCRRASGLPYRCGEDMAALLEQRLQRDRVVCDVATVEESDDYLGVCRHYGENLNEWLVRNGYAVANNVDSPYVALEREAADANRGLWRGVFERPSDWRERNEARR